MKKNWSNCSPVLSEKVLDPNFQFKNSSHPSAKYMFQLRLRFLYLFLMVKYFRVGVSKSLKVFEEFFRLSRVHITPQLLVLFWGCWWECVIVFIKSHLRSVAVLEKFSRVFSRCWNFFPGLIRGVLELSWVLNTPWILRLFSRVSTRCWWEGATDRGSEVPTWLL